MSIELPPRVFGTLQPLPGQDEREWIGGQASEQVGEQGGGEAARVRGCDSSGVRERPLPFRHRRCRSSHWRCHRSGRVGSQILCLNKMSL